MCRIHSRANYGHCDRSLRVRATPCPVPRLCAGIHTDDRFNFSLVNRTCLMNVPPGATYAIRHRIGVRPTSLLCYVKLSLFECCASAVYIKASHPSALLHPTNPSAKQSSFEPQKKSEQMRFILGLVIMVLSYVDFPVQSINNHNSAPCPEKTSRKGCPGPSTDPEIICSCCFDGYGRNVGYKTCS
ncbi:hypothetical protein PGT21_030286 [Puccinia graminis f. sp. tritici]|nr:hypothetical protein PGT21_030286 [Puccinia graminis f. sp. tritici]